MKNKYLIGSFIIGILVQGIVVIIPSLAEIFNLVNLNRNQWLITLGISLLPIPIIEVQKKINNKTRKNEKKVYINKQLYKSSV